MWADLTLLWHKGGLLHRTHPSRQTISCAGTRAAHLQPQQHICLGRVLAVPQNHLPLHVVHALAQAGQRPQPEHRCSDVLGEERPQASIGPPPSPAPCTAGAHARCRALVLRGPSEGASGGRPFPACGPLPHTTHRVANAGPCLAPPTSVRATDVVRRRHSSKGPTPRFTWRAELRELLRPDLHNAGWWGRCAGGSGGVGAATTTLNNLLLSPTRTCRPPSRPPGPWLSVARTRQANTRPVARRASTISRKCGR